MPDLRALSAGHPWSFANAPHKYEKNTLFGFLRNQDMVRLHGKTADAANYTSRKAAHGQKRDISGAQQSSAKKKRVQ